MKLGLMRHELGKFIDVSARSMGAPEGWLKGDGFTVHIIHEIAVQM